MKLANSIHKTARNFALKHKICLGRYGDGHGARQGYYYLGNANNPNQISFCKTAASAISMMKKHLKKNVLKNKDVEVVHNEHCELGDNYKDCPACIENKIN